MSAPSPRTGGTWAGGTLNDNDVFAATILLILIAPTALLALPKWRDTALRWLVDHHILVAPSDDTIIWVLPGNVAGLDLRRLILAVLAVATLLIIAGSWAWHLWQRRIQQRLISGDEQ